MQNSSRIYCDIFVLIQILCEIRSIYILEKFHPFFLTMWCVLTGFQPFDRLFQKIDHILQLYTGDIPQKIGIAIEKVVNFPLFQLKLKMFQCFQNGSKPPRLGVELLLTLILCSSIFFYHASL